MLKKKMFRDIRKNLSQFVAIFLMVFLGILVYAGIRSYMDGMKETADVFYKKNNLQDLNMLGYGFSLDDLNKVKQIKNVQNAERKLTVMAKMESDEDRTLQVNFIESNNISKFYVMDGMEFDINNDGVWMDNFYAKNNNLKVGDEITIKYDGISFTRKIVGLINVPDHVYDIKDESELFPTHDNYGFVYLSVNSFPEEYITNNIMKEYNLDSKEDLMFYMPDYNYKDYITYNYIMVDVDDEKNKNSVKSDIENSIENVLAVSDIKNELSYATYQGEIEEGETYVGIFSGLFLFIAVLSVITTMTRVVKKQRIQIGTLKALGFSKKKVTMHYVGYGFFVSLISIICGLIAGPLLIGRIFIGMEMSYLQIPNGHANVDISSFFVALIVLIVISFVTYFTCKKELKESPAETLRAKMPKVKKNSLNITSKGIFKKLKFDTIWNIRDIIRNKIRTVMGIAGITGCTMILVCAFGMLDTMNNFINWQFDRLYNFNYKISLKDNYTNDEYQNIINLYGNNTSQTLGIEIDNNGVKEANNIFVADASDMVRFTDSNYNYMKLEDNGVYVTKKLAKTKGYKIGDTIKFHIYGDNNWYEVKIIGFDKDPQNQNLKMTKKYLESLGINYKPDTVYTNTDLSNKDIVGASLIQDKVAIESGMSSMLNTMKTMIVLLIVVAAILGCVIIYNLGVLSFTEKQYQFSTLKVLGFSDKRIRKVYVKQNNWITVISIILGLPLGFLLLDVIFKMALSDAYDMYAYIKLLSYLIAVFGTFIISFSTSFVLAKKVNKIDMVTSLKGNE